MSVADCALSPVAVVLTVADTPGGACRVAVRAQVVPFQRNTAAANVLGVVWTAPAAVASVGERLATPLNTNPGLVVTCCQRVPFQWAIREVSAPVVRFCTSPRAQPSVAESMLTEVSSGIRFVFDGPGLGTRLQAVPSQCTISVLVSGGFGVWIFTREPTAQTSEEETASTALSERSPDPPGSVTGDQLVPSQCSVLPPLPTAQASEVDSALKALSWKLSLVIVPVPARGPAAGAAAPRVRIRAAPATAPASIRAVVVLARQTEPAICIAPPNQGPRPDHAARKPDAVTIGRVTTLYY